MVVHHVDDPAGRVQGRGGRQCDAEVTGMEPQAGAGRRRRLGLSLSLSLVLQRKLRLGDAFGASGDDPPLRTEGENLLFFSAMTIDCSASTLLLSWRRKILFQWNQKTKNKLHWSPTLLNFPGGTFNRD